MLDSQVHGRCGDRDKKDQMMYLLYHGIKKVDVVEEKVEELELNVGMVETGGGDVVCTAATYSASVVDVAKQQAVLAIP
ncbi:hypothetical protein Tco_0721324 [Tanacetum coccineum]